MKILLTLIVILLATVVGLLAWPQYQFRQASEAQKVRWQQMCQTDPLLKGSSVCK